MFKDHILRLVNSGQSALTTYVRAAHLIIGCRRAADAVKTNYLTLFHARDYSLSIGHFQRISS
jgi:hypothetical protein